MDTPYSGQDNFPQFDNINIQEIPNVIKTLLNQNRQAIRELLNQDAPTWDSLIPQLEDLNDKLNQTWSPIEHLNSVMNSKELTEAYQACLPMLSEYTTELGQNETLYQAYLSISEAESFQSLNAEQQRVIERALRDFKLSGIALPADKKQVYADNDKVLSKLCNQFNQNVLEATQAWTHHVKDKSELGGIPESAMEQAATLAQEKGKTGWIFTLEFPSYYAVITYAENRSLRELFYKAYSTRASDQMSAHPEFDNTLIMAQILKTRHHQAQLLGYDNYCDLSLATKMAQSSSEVLDFLYELAQKSKAHAESDFKELHSFAEEQGFNGELMPWDVGYYSEKLSESKYAISQEALRAYFPEAKVMKGLFHVISTLFSVNIVEKQDNHLWHSDVKFYELTTKGGQLIGHCYVDLYARPHKRGGAWMDEYRVRKQWSSNNLQTPIAYVTCNFNGPSKDKPALFTHNEVTTLFHEFGHALHHLLTQMSYPSVSGINGVEWDAVELPSQLMENWCWDAEALKIISGHYETGEPLPSETITQLNASKNFHSGLMMVRQLEFALFDFLIHKNLCPNKADEQVASFIQDTLNEVRNEVAVIKPPVFNRFQHGFSHIFGGGYAAGYYSYKWAEVLASDAFSLFEEEGIFNPRTGEKFKQSVLEQGGSKDALDLFIEFRGRPPETEALLKQSGLQA